MENFTGILFGIFLLILMTVLLSIIYFFLQKYLGIKIIPRFSAHKEYQNQLEIKNQLANLDTELVSKAINQTEKKGFLKTHENVLVEAIKIKNKEKAINPYVFIDKNTLKEAISIVNNYYYDLQRDTNFLVGMTLEDVHKSIIRNSSLELFLEGHSKIQYQYLKGLISHDEYRIKRKEILSNAINNTKN